MSRGKKLSDCEQQRIIDLKSCGKTQREIANIIGRSQNVIGNFLRAGLNNYGSKKSPGRPPKVSTRDKRKALRELAKPGSSANKVVRQLNLNIDHSLVRKWAYQSKRFKYLKGTKKPVLKARHKTERIKFAEKYVQQGEIFKNIAFSDEKNSI